MIWTVLDWLAANWIGVTLIAALVCAVGWYLWFDNRQAARLDDVEWDTEWQREPVTEEDAAVLIADLRGDEPDIRDSSTWPIADGDVWDQWWAGIDGLERECMLVHDLLVSEARLWAELKAETKELCPA